jgi:hypothetical protein
MELQHDLQALAEQRGQSKKQFLSQIAASMYAQSFFTFQDAMAFAGVDDLEMKHILGLYFIPIRWEELTASRPKVERKAGFLKGNLIYMAEDFDAPLEEEFKDYM